MHLLYKKISSTSSTIIMHFGKEQVTSYMTFFQDTYTVDKTLHKEQFQRPITISFLALELLTVLLFYISVGIKSCQLSLFGSTKATSCAKNIAKRLMFGTTRRTL